MILLTQEAWAIVLLRASIWHDYLLQRHIDSSTDEQQITSITKVQLTLLKREVLIKCFKVSRTSLSSFHAMDRVIFSAKELLQCKAVGRIDLYIFPLPSRHLLIKAIFLAIVSNLTSQIAFGQEVR